MFPTTLKFFDKRQGNWYANFVANIFCFNIFRSLTKKNLFSSIAIPKPLVIYSTANHDKGLSFQ